MSKKWEKFADEYVVSLFPIFMLVAAFTQGFKKILGQSVDVLCKIENHAIKYYNQPTNWHAGHLALVGMIKKNPDCLQKAYNLMERLGKKQIKETMVFHRGLNKKSNKELNQYYQNYIKSNTLIYSYGLLLPLLDYNESTFLSDELARILKAKRREKYFGTLTTPLRSTYNKSQELALLKILADIKLDKILTRKFKTLNSFELVKEFSGRANKLWDRLENHAAKYRWVNYVYEGPALEITDYIDILRDMMKRGLNPNEELNSYSQKGKELKIEQRKILKELKLNSAESKIVGLAQTAVFIKPYRRELQSRSYYNLEFLLAEIARRLNLSLRQARMMLPREIAAALLQGKIKTESINERLNLMLYGDQKGKEICLVGRSAREFINKNLAKEAKVKATKNIQGTTAYAGRVKGIVKLINMPEEMSKMVAGDILVAATTSPNLMPAIRKAAALVTNEGGLTCHAAIVSRELRIPCVVGTKIATKVLKDGDLVEVDAAEGWVKIIDNKKLIKINKYY